MDSNFEIFQLKEGENDDCHYDNYVNENPKSYFRFITSHSIIKSANEGGNFIFCKPENEILYEIKMEEGDTIFWYNLIPTHNSNSNAQMDEMSSYQLSPVLSGKLLTLRKFIHNKYE